MISITLNDPQSLPHEFLTHLRKYDRFFEREKSLEKLEKIEGFTGLVQKINSFCKKNMVIGFHYSRAIPEEISKEGLIVRSGEEIRSNFIRRFGNHFTQLQLEEIKSKWARSLNHQMVEARDGKIFFNFTRDGLNNGGTAPLLEYYGGEQVYFYIRDIPGVSEKLKSIGKPLIIKCKLNPNLVRTFIEYPWGKILTSSYHRQINPEVICIDQDGWQEVSVPPEQIEIESS